MHPKFHTAKKKISSHPAISRPRATYAKHRYSTPLFVIRETLGAFNLHNGFSISASLSFYAMFALIPMALLMFFLLSHLVISSNYAIVKLAIITSNVLPKFSHRIMIEVYNVSRHQAVWGAFGIFVLFWLVTPLAGALRSAFYTISSMIEAPSYIKRKVKDACAVVGILFMFFLFTFAGLMLEKIIHFLHPTSAHVSLINLTSSLLLSTALIAIFYRIFFPAKIAVSHIVIGSLITAILWIAMRPAFGIFLSLNESYSSIFGGMKNMFISIGWLYYTFAVFLLGTELIATLHKKDVLLLKALFSELPHDRELYLNRLMKKYGKVYSAGDYVFRQGDTEYDLYYIVSGKVTLLTEGSTLRHLEAGDYFGEMAMLTESTRIADARVDSNIAEIIVVSSANIETLLMGEPKVAMNFLKTLAKRLHQSDKRQSMAEHH